MEQKDYSFAQKYKPYKLLKEYCKQNLNTTTADPLNQSVLY